MQGVVPALEGAPTLEGVITVGEGFSGSIQAGQRGTWKSFPKVLILELHFELVKQRRGATHDIYSITIC